jgi:predicted nuclease with TOPRIM domain
MTVEATDIEKKSLEAHVELCAERYNALEDKMSTMAENIAHLCEMVKEVKSSVSKLSEKNTDRLISWGIGIIGFLSASTIYLISHYVLK